MMFELNSISRKLDHLTMTQNHAVKYAERNLAQASLFEAQGELSLAQTEFKRLTYNASPTVGPEANLGLNRIRVKRLLSRINDATVNEVKHLLSVVGSTPRLGQVWLKSLKFALALKQGDTAAAIAIGDPLIELPGVPSTVTIEYARFLAGQQAIDKAGAILNRFVQAHPKSGEGWAALGALQKQTQAYSNAVTSYEKALEIEPKPTYLLSAARLHMTLGKWENAHTLINPIQFPPALQNDAFKLKAACLFQLKAYTQAANLYQNAYDIQADPKTLLSKVIALQVAGQYEAALQAVESIIDNALELPQIHFHHGQILIGSGLTAKASEAYRQFLRLAEKVPEHSKRVQHASNWMRQYQRSLIVPDTFQGSDPTTPVQQPAQ